MIKLPLLLSAFYGLVSCQNSEREISPPEEVMPVVQKKTVTSKTTFEKKCERQGLPIYPLFPNALEKTLSFSASRIDVKDWLSNFDDNQVTDNEIKYLELLTTYDTSAKLSYHRDYFDFLLENWLDLQTSLKQKHENKKIRRFESQPHFVVGLTKSPVNALLLLSINISLLERSYDPFFKALASIKEYEIKDAKETRAFYASQGGADVNCAPCAGFDLDIPNKGAITHWDPSVWPLVNIIYNKNKNKKHNYYEDNKHYYVTSRNFYGNKYTFFSVFFIYEDKENLSSRKLCSNHDVKAIWDYVLYKDRDRSDFSPQDIENYETSKQIYLNADIESE